MPKESGADAPFATGGCKYSQLKVYSKGTMVVCELPQPRDHCTAHQACDNGWHLCAMSEFIMWGGKTEPAPEKAWLQGCLPQGYNGFAIPMDGFCSCNPGSGSAFTATWTCSGVGAPATSSALLGLGILADTSVHALGTVYNPNDCAHWSAEPPAAQHGAAVCCQ